jgi:hypothetical protein
MLAKRPEDRYQQPAEVAQALRPWVPAPSPGSVEAAVTAGLPVDLFPPTAGEATPKFPPVALPVAIPVTPRRGTVARAVTATVRALVGCFALFLLLIISMIAGLIFLPRSDRGPPQTSEPSDRGPPQTSEPSDRGPPQTPGPSEHGPPQR